jgi:serine/threonine-protein kinase RsbW
VPEVPSAAFLVLPRRRHTVPAARALAEQALREARVVPEIIDDLSLALSEACTNAVRHASGDEYRVDVMLDGDRCTIIVEDDGFGFAPPERPEMPPPDADSGRGLPLIHALVDELAVGTSSSGGAVVTMVRKVDVAGVTVSG